MCLRGPIEQFPNMSAVLVKGVKVDITLEEINSLFWKEKKQKGMTFAKKIATKGIQLQWVPNTIAVGQPIWAIKEGKILTKN